MKTLKLLFATIVIGISISACSVVIEDDEYYVPLEEVVTSYDLWYIDYNKTQGTGDVPFLSKAFTISFINGKVFANNNLVGLGFTGNGYGIQIGYYDTFNGFLKIDHDYNGYFDFDVVQLSNDRIKLIDNYNKVTYFLEGYQKHNFDFDKVFYDNIEYFLQEYDAWEKSYVSTTGKVNAFDNENFLAFTPENLTTFYSSQDKIGTTIANVYWDYVGDYNVSNVKGYDNLKVLTLHYDSQDNEAFELSVINDRKISLYHISSGTTYEFTGKGVIYYKKSSSQEKSVRNEGRKRTKVDRETIIRIH